VRVRLVDRAERAQVDRVFSVERPDGAEAIVEFDTAPGFYRLDVTAPKYGCGTSDVLYFIPGHTRSIAEQLDTVRPSPQAPVLLSGTAPQSMLYANPTIVAFDKTAAACGKPIPQPLSTVRVTVENDQDAYYAAIFNEDPERAPGSEQLALRLQTATHQHHYVRLPIDYPTPPAITTLNVTDDMVDALATEPVDTLLCPKMWKTSAG
jgi:hypothetical protein